MSEPEGVRPTTEVEQLSDSEKWRQTVFGFQETLLGVLSNLQPLVVLFSLSIVVATFTRPLFPESSDWSLAAAFGFPGLADLCVIINIKSDTFSS